MDEDIDSDIITLQLTKKIGRKSKYVRCQNQDVKILVQGRITGGNKYNDIKYKKKLVLLLQLQLSRTGRSDWITILIAKTWELQLTDNSVMN